MTMILKPEEFKAEMLKNYDTITTQARGHKKGTTYLNCVTAFDTETTTLDEYNVNFMYIWQFQFSTDYTIIGRTWDEFRTFMHEVEEGLNGANLIVFVHNLSYDFQYLQGVLKFETPDVFATDSRKVLKAKTGPFEFRCSMLLTNMSLYQFTTTWNVEHKKLKEEAKRENMYKQRLFPWTKLNDVEFNYCVNDVLGLVEAITAKMNFDGDTLETIPLTSTGYVRRDLKKAMSKFDHRKISAMQPDVDVYKLLLKAYRGGNTHANRYNSTKLLKGVVSWDRSSSYPHVLCTELYPMTPFEKQEATAEALEKALNWGKAVLVEMNVTNCRLKDEFNPCPYISTSKCEGLILRSTKKQPCPNVFDNGRLLKQGQEEPFSIALTDIDLEIMCEQYEFDYEITKLYTSTYGPLPDPLVTCIERYYDKKTALKNVSGSEMLYEKNKALLNACYGICVQKPCRQAIEYVDGDWVKGEFNYEEDLERNRMKGFLLYQHGVWCCAYARLWLQKGIDLVGDRFIYCDTDSVKYKEDPENPVDWEELNADLRERAKLFKCYAKDPKGETHYMGVFEKDGTYEKFCTMGSKRYAYTTLNKEGEEELHITISGVNKQDGAEELGDIENFRDGFIFQNSGKTASEYHDHPEMKTLEIEGHSIEITPFIIIRDTTYELSLSDEYSTLLAHLLAGKN